MFQSSPPVAEGRYGSRTIGGNHGYFGTHFANRCSNHFPCFHWIPNQLTLSQEFNYLNVARTSPLFHVSLGFALHAITFYNTSGPSKSVALKTPCSLTSQPLDSAKR